MDCLSVRGRGSPSPMDVLQLTRDLVQIPSISGLEGEVGVYIADRLEAQGWRVVRQTIPPAEGVEAKKPRLNVLALPDEHRAPEVVLTTHIDTVPPFIPISEDDTYLYGRGTCDAKGIFAAQWVAAEALRQKGERRVALLGVVGEETDSLGAKHVDQILPKVRWIVDGEPTDSRFAAGAKGVLSLKLSVEGQAAHSAYPEKGDSAAHALLEALAPLLKAKLPFEEKFGPTTVNIGLLQAGLAPNVLAPLATAALMVRLGTDRKTVLHEIERILGPRVNIEVVSQSEPQEIFVPQDQSGILVRFGSDVPHLSHLGTPLLVGPGSIHDAHTSGEKIAKQELLDSVVLYERLAETLLNL